MPYKIEPTDGKFEVINSDTGKVFGTHATRAKAEAQMRALYANEPEAEEPKEEPKEEKSLGAYAKSLGLTIPADTLAVKSIGADEIRGYSHLWGSERLTDIEVEYFTKSTDFWDKTLGKQIRPLTWDHAQDAEFKASPVIGSIVDFGDDEVGRWYVARLDRAHRYRSAVDALIKSGKLGTSSDSAPQYVERVKTGKSTWLKTWPFFAAALTDQPCEPRMLTDGSIEYLKSLGISLPDAPDMARELEVLQLRARVLHIRGD
jgi:hypothetical protein